MSRPGWLRRRPPAGPAPSAADVLERLDEPFRSALRSMYRNEPQQGRDGQHELDRNTRISPEQGLWLHDTYRELRPVASLEIGLAYGFSTLFFLAALTRNGSGRHTAVDPLQNSTWHGMGLEKVREVGARDFEFLEALCAHAVTDLARQGRVFDLIFIDGNHRFDDVLVDFTLCAPLLAEGGLVVLDDMWMRSVKAAVDFVRTNRADFEAVRTPLPTVAAFRRTAPDRRSWDHFESFRVD